MIYIGSIGMLPREFLEPSLAAYTLNSLSSRQQRVQSSLRQYCRDETAIPTITPERDRSEGCLVRRM